MKRPLLLTGTALLAVVALSGCANTSNVAQDLKALGDAGCKGDLHVEGGVATATGLSPGAAHAQINFDGSCDPKDRPAPSPVGNAGALSAPAA